MNNLEKINLPDDSCYYKWLEGKIQGMKDALDSGQNFEHMSGDALRRKLSAYEKALNELKL